MNENVRLTAPTLRVLKLLLEMPLERWSGADISRRVTVGYGTLYPMLNRLEKVGWVTSEWEVIDPSEAGRPRRRFYKLSALGQAKAREAFVDLQVAPEVLVWTS